MPEFKPITCKLPLEAGSPELARALKLLSAAVEWVHQALDLMREGDRIGADVAIQRLYAVLPELFNCRKLGDGFAAVINAVQCGIENMNGVPLDLPHIQAISRVLVAIRSEPFLSLSAGCEYAVLLEESGLAIEPAGYSHLIDWLDGESVR